MPYIIELEESRKTFTINEGETILTAAQRNNIKLAYGCKNGACRSCKAKILEGQFLQTKFISSALSEDEIKKNIALLCCTEAKSNMKILAHELICMDGQEITKKTCKIIKINKISPDIIILEIQLPKKVIFDFLPGQYVEILLPQGIRRPYSLSNTATKAKEGILEFHIRHVKGGLFTDWLFKEGKIGDSLRFEGPLGTFFLRNDTSKPIIFLASGTGFAPIKAIIEDSIKQKSSRQMILYWGAKNKTDLYMMELAYSWQQQLPHFSFVPVLSEFPTVETWKGKIGLVHQIVVEDFPDLSNFEIYACGSPTMVNLARRDFITKHLLPEQAFFADAFTNSATKG